MLMFLLRWERSYVARNARSEVMLQADGNEWAKNVIMYTELQRTRLVHGILSLVRSNWKGSNIKKTRKSVSPECAN